MTGKKPQNVALFWALLATALWGGTFLGPTAVEPVGPIHLVFGRYFVFGILALIVLAARISKVVILGHTNILAALHLGVFGYIGFYLLFSLSASVGGGAFASIVTGAMPAFVTIGSNVLKKEIAWRSLALPIAITSGGILLINLQPTNFLLDKSSRDLLIATALSLSASAMWAYFVVVNGVILKRHSGPKIDNTTWTALIGTGAFVASFLLLPFASKEPFLEFSFSNTILIRYIFVIILLATLGSWCASWTWNRASKSLSTVIMGQLIAMETVFGLIFNLMWDQRWPAALEVAGAVLILFGVALCVRSFENARTAEAEN